MVDGFITLRLSKLMLLRLYDFCIWILVQFRSYLRLFWSTIDWLDLFFLWRKMLGASGACSAFLIAIWIVTVNQLSNIVFFISNIVKNIVIHFLRILKFHLIHILLHSFLMEQCFELLFSFSIRLGLTNFFNFRLGWKHYFRVHFRWLVLRRQNDFLLFRRILILVTTFKLILWFNQVVHSILWNNWICTPITRILFIWTAWFIILLLICLDKWTFL